MMQALRIAAALTVLGLSGFIVSGWTIPLIASLFGIKFVVEGAGVVAAGYAFTLVNFFTFFAAAIVALIFWAIFGFIAAVALD